MLLENVKEMMEIEVFVFFRTNSQWMLTIGTWPISVGKRILLCLQQSSLPKRCIQWYLEVGFIYKPVKLLRIVDS